MTYNSSNHTISTTVPFNAGVHTFRLSSGHSWDTDWSISVQGQQADAVYEKPNTLIDKLHLTDADYSPVNGFEAKVNVPEPDIAYADGDSFTATADNWITTVNDLPYFYYDKAAEKYYTYRYKVEELSIIDADGNVLETVVQNADYTGGESTRFTVVYDNSHTGTAADPLKITNTKKDLVSISGTKKWVDNREHNNASEITLSLERKLKSGSDASWEVVDPTPAVTWEGNTYKFDNLPMYDNSTPKQEYEYRVKETAVNVTEGSETIHYVTTYPDNQDYAGDGDTITNTEYTDFDFNKIWLSNNAGSGVAQDWAPGTVITITLYRNATYSAGQETKYIQEETVGTYSIPVGGISDSNISVTKDANNWYVIKFEGLEKFVAEKPADAESEVEWIYYVNEPTEVAGYTISYGGEDGIAVESQSYAKDGESVINSMITVVLPSAGGPGTRIFTILGSLLAVLAGTLLLTRRKKMI